MTLPFLDAALGRGVAPGSMDAVVGAVVGFVVRVNALELLPQDGGVGEHGVKVGEDGLDSLAFVAHVSEYRAVVCKRAVQL